jgi:hypothetical protein
MEMRAQFHAMASLPREINFQCSLNSKMGKPYSAEYIKGEVVSVLMKKWWGVEV